MFLHLSPPSNWIPSDTMVANSYVGHYSHPNNNYYYNGSYPFYPNMMMNTRLIPRPRGMNMMPSAPIWT